MPCRTRFNKEQAESDAAKVKAMRTTVGWFSSPACSLIYQTSKYVALFSSKGYAIGANFAQWLAHKLKTTEECACELIGHIEDLLAICAAGETTSSTTATTTQATRMGCVASRCSLHVPCFVLGLGYAKIPKST